MGVPRTSSIGRGKTDSAEQKYDNAIDRHLFCSGSAEEGQRQRTLALWIKRFDDMTPTLALAAVDLAQTEPRPLHHLAARTAPTLDNAPVTMLLAIFAPSITSQEQDSHR